MGTFRINKTKDYTIMSNSHLREKDMSLKAKGLLSVMLSLPDNWDFSVVGLSKLSKDGKDSVMNTLNELESFGYLVRTKVINDKRQFEGFVYDIFETPHPENPCPENPDTEKPYTENPPQLNTNILNTKSLNINEEKENTIKESKTRRHYGEFGRVLLTDAEYERLVNEFGEERIKLQIRLVDEYVESNNNKNKYTNFNLVIRKSIKDNWFKLPTTSKQVCSIYDNLE